MKEWERRYWSYVNKNGPIPPHRPHLGRCWEWISYLCHGHGRTSIDGKEFYAHRVAYLLKHGSIPDGLQVCHKCDNPKCQRPSHLFAGTQMDNVHDAIKKGRLKMPPHVQGERQGHSRLTAQKVLAIRASYQGKHGDLARLGREYGVTLQCIYLIVTRKNWFHI